MSRCALSFFFSDFSFDLCYILLVRKFLWLPLVVFLIFTAVIVVRPPVEKAVVSDVPAEDFDFDVFTNPFKWWEPWTRPDGPVKIALQIGHLDQANVDAELESIRRNTGTSGGGFTELEVNTMIAQETKDILEGYGYTVELLSAAITPRYWADVFVSIHADGSTDKKASGYKVAAARMDQTGKADRLAALLEDAYDDFVDLPRDPNVTRNMRGYYAFNWRRYEHSIHPMTTPAIVETGFLTNAGDREIIAEQPELPAQGIAEGIRRFVVEELGF